MNEEVKESIALGGGDSIHPPKNKKCREPSSKGTIRLVTNQLLSFPTTLQGSYWATRDRIPVSNIPPLDRSALGTLQLSCLLVFLQSPWTFVTFSVWGKVKDFVDLLLCSAGIAILTDTWIFDPSSIVK